jgi:ribosomal protein S18 acetylase RimI-like enzyme
VWGAACFDLDPSVLNAGAAVSELAVKMRELGCWALTIPEMETGDVEGLLEAQGFQRIKEAAGMVVDAASFKPTPSPDDLRVQIISSEGEWAAWSSILCRNLFGKQELADFAGFASIGKALAASGRMKAFIGKDLSGTPVATSASYICHDGQGGVFFVSTEAACRRRGYGAALTSAATADCFKAGALRVALSATDAGRPVYASLGYRVEAVLGRYGPPPIAQE